MDVKASSK
jgi:hypothetical protein